MWQEEEGVLTFEWILLVTLLTIGIVSGLTAARDAIIDELSDVAEAMLSLDQSYTIDHPLIVTVHTTQNPLTDSQGVNSGFLDNFTFTHCSRGILVDQGVIPNCNVGS
jgi:Flp pilus assembly pilin Flp